MSDNALSRVLDQAEAASQNFSEEPGTSLATRENSSLAQAQQNAVASRPSLDSLMDSSGITVDEYLTVKYEGFRLDKVAPGLFDELVVSIDMTQVVPITQVRANRGGSTTFIKSYDGVSTPDGQNFQRAIQHLEQTHERVDRPYQTSEIPMTVLEDTVISGKNGGTIKAGYRIGTTPPFTGVGLFAEFLKVLRKEGLMGAIVRVKVTHVPKRNTNNNEWGIAAFELLGEIDG